MTARVGIVLLLAGCASAPKESSIGRVESRMERGHTIDVLAVNAPIRIEAARDRVLMAFAAHQITEVRPRLEEVEHRNDELVYGNTQRSVACERNESVASVSSDPGDAIPSGPSSCYIQLTVMWDADTAGTRFRVSGAEIATLGGRLGSGYLRPKSRHWALVRAIARELAAP